MKLSTYVGNNIEKFDCPEWFYRGKCDDIELIIDEDMDEYDSIARRPYYRLRGKPVSQEQAFEVIRRTDSIFRFGIQVPWNSDYVETWHINNWWFNRNHFPSDMGWIHSDGTVGGNGITDKYPNFSELLSDMVELIQAFPYLDFVLAITTWDELPEEMFFCDREDWEGDDQSYEEFEEKRKFERYDGFYDAIDIGFWVHDNKIEVLNPKNAVKKYKEYEKKYSVKNQDYYAADYNMENGIIPCDEDYLKRCIAAYGLDPEETLKNTREYIWKPGVK